MLIILTKLLILFVTVFNCSASILKDPDNKHATEIKMFIEATQWMEAKMESMEVNTKNMEAKMENMEEKMENMEIQTKHIEAKMESMEAKMEIMKAKMENIEIHTKHMEAKMENMEIEKQNMGMKLLYFESIVNKQTETINRQIDEEMVSKSKQLTRHSQKIKIHKVLIQQLLRQQTKNEEKLNNNVSANVCGCSMETENDETKDSGINKRAGRNNSIAMTSRSSTNHKQMAKLGQQSGSNNRTERQAPEHIAFSAYLDHELLNLGHDYVIPFNGIVLNEGNAYNHFTGVFTTPKNGVYLFSFIIENTHVHNLWVKLVVDGTLISSAVSHPITTDHNNQGGNVVVTRLTAGQSVWVAIESTESGDSVEGNTGYRLTTFSGVFLYS